MLKLYLFFIALVLALPPLLPAFLQDADGAPTPALVETPVEIIPTATFTATPSPALSFTSAPTVVPTETLAATETNTPLPTLVEATENATQAPTAESTAVVIPPTEAVTASPEASIEPMEATPETTPLLEVTVEPTEITPEVTPPLTAEMSSTTPEGTPELTQTATPTGELITQLVVGTVRYQSRLVGNAGIQIIILDINHFPLAIAYTNTDGQYQIPVPVNTAYWLVAEAPMHVHFEVGLSQLEPLPDLVLRGGDLDNNGCVGEVDIQLLTDHFEEVGSTVADINGDAITDASDLAILAGNYDPLCDIAPVETTPTVTPSTEETEIITTPEATATAQPTGEVTESPEATPAVFEPPT